VFWLAAAAYPAEPSDCNDDDDDERLWLLDVSRGIQPDQCRQQELMKMMMMMMTDADTGRHSRRNADNTPT